MSSTRRSVDSHRKMQIVPDRARRATVSGSMSIDSIVLSSAVNSSAAARHLPPSHQGHRVHHDRVYHDRAITALLANLFFFCALLPFVSPLPSSSDVQL